jgi:hypothetical protein
LTIGQGGTGIIPRRWRADMLMTGQNPESEGGPMDGIAVSQGFIDRVGVLNEFRTKRIEQIGIDAGAHKAAFRH